MSIIILIRLACEESKHDAANDFSHRRHRQYRRRGRFRTSAPGGIPVRAIVRSRDARSAALQARGAEVVIADIFDPDQLVAAMRGVQRAYYVPPYDPYVIQSAVTFAVAAREAKLQVIVQLGQWLSHRSHPALMTRQTWLMDKMFAELRGIAHTILNPGLFADDFLRTIDFAVLLGVFPVLAGVGRVAPVANEDIAQTAVAVLMAPERHDGRTYRPTGAATAVGPGDGGDCRQGRRSSGPAR